MTSTPLEETTASMTVGESLALAMARIGVPAGTLIEPYPRRKRGGQPGQPESEVLAACLGLLESLGPWTVVIENYHPPRLNELMGHWRKAHRLKMACADMVALRCRLAGVPPATGKRRVTLVLTLAPRQRGGDPDAYWKGLADALVQCHALKDDSRQWCELAPVEYRRGTARATEVRLEDL